MGSFGFWVHAPISRTFYSSLDRDVPDRTPSALIKKVITQRYLFTKLIFDLFVALDILRADDMGAELFIANDHFPRHFKWRQSPCNLPKSYTQVTIAGYKLVVDLASCSFSKLLYCSNSIQTAVSQLCPNSEQRCF